MIDRHHQTTTLPRYLTHLLLLLLTAATLFSSGAVLATSTTGVVVDSDTSTIRRPESYGKPHQSRIWYNEYAGRWDALVPKDDNNGGTSASDHYIMLDVDGSQTFTGLELQDRDFARSDVFWDARNKKLYALASHPTQSQFWRVGYDDATDQYALEVGSPGTGVSVPGLNHPDAGNGGNSAATIGVTPDGRVYAAVMRDDSGLIVQYSADGGATWLAAPVTLNASAGVGVTTWKLFKQGDVLYQGLFAGENGEGGSATQFFFWYIPVSADPTNPANWTDDSANIPAPAGSDQSDDHVSAARDAAGNLYFAVKTEDGGPTDPLINLYRRTTSGVWSQHLVTETQAPTQLSRPSIAIDDSNREIYIFANGGEGVSPTEREAGYIKAPLDALDTLSAAPFVPLFSLPNTIFTDIISPRQAVTNHTGLVVTAHNRTDKTVWYSALELAAPPVVEAGANQQAFEHHIVMLDPATFVDPNVLDTHTALIDWGDGTPVEAGVIDQVAHTVAGRHIYTSPGRYTVTVKVLDSSGLGGSDTFRVTVLHAFLNYCAYAGDDDLKLEEFATADCSLLGEEKVELKKDAAAAGDVVSRGDDVVVDDRAAVGGAGYAARDFTLKDDSSLGGDVTAGDDIKLEHGAVVGGNATAADEVDVARTAIVHGIITENANVPPFHPVTGVNFGITAGGPDFIVAENTTQLLPPGVYGKVEVKENATLILGPGVYRIKELKVKDDGALHFNLNGASVVIAVQKNIRFEKRVQMSVEGGAASDILILATGDEIEMGEGGRYLGTYLAPDTKIELKKNAHLTGALYGKKVTLEEAATLQSAPALDGFATLFIPEE